ncbi:hypothetical protein AB3N59_03110 [Leptospira sp. WS92.C1]
MISTTPLPSGLGGTTAVFLSITFSREFLAIFLINGVWIWESSHNGPKNNINGGKRADWDRSHSIKTGPTQFNSARYSYSGESSILAINLGPTKIVE